MAKSRWYDHLEGITDLPLKEATNYQRLNVDEMAFNLLDFYEKATSRQVEIYVFVVDVQKYCFVTDFYFDTLERAWQEEGSDTYLEGYPIEEIPLPEIIESIEFFMATNNLS